MDEIICECGHDYECHGRGDDRGCTQCGCQSSELDVMLSHVAALRSLLSDAIDALKDALLNEGQDACCVPVLGEGNCHCFRCKARAVIAKATLTGGE